MGGGDPIAVAKASKIPWHLQPAGVADAQGGDPKIYDADGDLFKKLEENFPGKNETVRFSTMHHGFVTRGDIKDGNFKAGEGAEVREKVKEALDLTITFFRKH